MFPRPGGNMTQFKKADLDLSDPDALCTGDGYRILLNDLEGDLKKVDSQPVKVDEYLKKPTNLLSPMPTACRILSAKTPPAQPPWRNARRKSHCSYLRRLAAKGEGQRGKLLRFHLNSF